MKAATRLSFVLLALLLTACTKYDVANLHVSVDNTTSQQPIVVTVTSSAGSVTAEGFSNPTFTVPAGSNDGDFFGDYIPRLGSNVMVTAAFKGQPEDERLIFHPLEDYPVVYWVDIVATEREIVIECDSNNGPCPQPLGLDQLHK